MAFQKITNKVDEEFLTVKLSSGLTLIMNPKKGFSKTMGILGVRFGSADNLLPGEDGAPSLRLPDGTAHFLEHKLFEDEEGDVSDRYAANGAQCNASTGFNTTSYLFSCTDKVGDNLKLLLSSVQSPYFTEELVKKEQGIIQQEIKMYEDDPGWIVFFNLLEMLYREHPARHNIAGTVESISEITPDFLNSCYQGFYRPGNMVLVLSGGFDAEEVYQIAEEDAAARTTDTRGLCSRLFRESDTSPAGSSKSAEMIVFRPKLLIGFKETEVTEEGRRCEKIELITQIILDALLSKSSVWHDAAFSRGLIDDTFSAYYSSYGDFGFSLLGADTKDPERLAERLLAVFEEARADGIAPDVFERIRNKYMGNYTRMFNSIESTAYSSMACFFRGFFPSEIVDILQEITLGDLNDRLASHFVQERMALSVILPTSEKG